MKSFLEATKILDSEYHKDTLEYPYLDDDGVEQIGKVEIGIRKRVPMGMIEKVTILTDAVDEQGKAIKIPRIDNIDFVASLVFLVGDDGPIKLTGEMLRERDPRITQNIQVLVAKYHGEDVTGSKKGKPAGKKSAPKK